MMRRLAAQLAVAAGLLTLVACGAHAPRTPTPMRAGPSALAAYRVIAESIYVRSTKSVVAVTTASLDTACALASCGDIRARWGMETLWWARGDSIEAHDALASLLDQASASVDLSAVTAGQSMLFAADAGDVPGPGAGANEWIRFRAAHADAAGAIRMSPVGVSRSGRTAIALVDWRCGPTCGHRLGVALRATSDTTWAIDEMLLLSSNQRR